MALRSPEFLSRLFGANESDAPKKKAAERRPDASAEQEEGTGAWEQVAVPEKELVTIEGLVKSVDDDTFEQKWAAVQKRETSLRTRVNDLHDRLREYSKEEEGKGKEGYTVKLTERQKVLRDALRKKYVEATLDLKNLGETLTTYDVAARVRSERAELAKRFEGLQEEAEQLKQPDDHESDLRKDIQVLKRQKKGKFGKPQTTEIVDHQLTEKEREHERILNTRVDELQKVMVMRDEAEARMKRPLKEWIVDAGIRVEEEKLDNKTQVLGEEQEDKKTVEKDGSWQGFIQGLQAKRVSSDARSYRQEREKQLGRARELLHALSSKPEEKEKFIQALETVGMRVKRVAKEPLPAVAAPPEVKPALNAEREQSPKSEKGAAPDVKVGDEQAVSEMLVSIKANMAAAEAAGFPLADARGTGGAPPVEVAPVVAQEVRQSVGPKPLELELRNGTRIQLEVGSRIRIPALRVEYTVEKVTRKGITCTDEKGYMLKFLKKELSSHFNSDWELVQSRRKKGKKVTAETFNLVRPAAKGEKGKTEAA